MLHMIIVKVLSMRLLTNWMQRRRCAGRHGMRHGLELLSGFTLIKKSARMFCRYCEKDKECQSEFGKQGSINMQHSALTEHARCRAHEDAEYMCGVKRVRIEDGIHKSKNATMQGTMSLFACAYHVAKEDLAFTTYKSTLDLLSKCGCPNLIREMYQNDKACASFVQCINEDLLIKIVKRIKASMFYSLMMDESTNIGLDQHLIVYASFIEDFEPVTVFLGLLEIEDGTSQHLYERSCFFLSQLQLDVSKMVCMGTDGASAMTGRVNGLTTRFKRENPFMTSIHCIAHRASLCLADAVKGSQYAQYIDEVMNEIAAVFSKSPAKSFL